MLCYAVEMRKWGIVLLVLAGLLLALLLVGMPDTGGEVRPRRSPPIASVDPEPLPEPEAEEPRERPRPVVKPAPELEEGERIVREDGQPLPPATSPEGEMAARVAPMWSGVVQQLSDKANFHPDATGLESQAVMILREIDRVVREEGDPKELERLQREAIDALRKSDLQDEAMQQELDGVERELERWHQQTEGVPPEP
jgi:hypothetical protein